MISFLILGFFIFLFAYISIEFEDAERDRVKNRKSMPQ